MIRHLPQMVVWQQLGPQRLGRRPETMSRITDQADHVLAYDQVMVTKLVAVYAAALSMIQRARPEGVAGNAIDLACGPGHFSLCLSSCLGCANGTGVDLSRRMVEVARANASTAATAFSFQEGDIVNLNEIAADQYDLASCLNAMHHLDDLDQVRRVFLEMNRVTRPDGLIVVLDLVRLRTASLTERYVQLLGADYRKRGLESFYNDFHSSMFAAFTADELQSAIPHDTGRWWCQLVPRGLPTAQIVLGLPEGRRRLFLRKGWAMEQHPLVRQWSSRWQEAVGERWARETRWDCRLVELGLASGRRQWVAPLSSAGNKRRLGS